LYLTISYPEIIPVVQSFASGIYAPLVGGKSCLIVKCSKEMILAAQIKRQFSIYLAQVKLSKFEYGYAVITAVFDEGLSPLTITTPLSKDDPHTLELIELFKSETFQIFFFDFNDRELLSCEARVTANSLFNRIRNYRLSKTGHEKAVIDAVKIWFSGTGKSDDERATKVILGKNLFPDDFVIIDMTMDAGDVLGAKPVSSSSLLREEPGQYQEQDIVLALRGAYRSDQIYLNPVKEVDGEEFTDVLVMGEQAILLIQAKDSPNPQKTINSTLDRKRLKSTSQLQGGINQLKGAISFVRGDPKLRFSLNGEAVEIDVSGKPIVNVVIVKELFDDMYAEYSKIVFDHMEKTRVNTVFFDFSEFAKMAFYCKSEELFLGAVEQILDATVRHKQFPRLRYSGKPE